MLEKWSGKELRIRGSMVLGIRPPIRGGILSELYSGVWPVALSSLSVLTTADVAGESVAIQRKERVSVELTSPWNVD